MSWKSIPKVQKIKGIAEMCNFESWQKFSCTPMVLAVETLDREDMDWS
jgi:hypothetical protein